MTQSVILSEIEMFDQLMTEIRYIRLRLDTHIDDEERTFVELRRDVAGIQEQMAVHKTRMGMISSGIAAGVAIVVSWVAAQFGK